MRALVQRVTRAEVRVGGDRVASIGRGLLVLLGVHRDDDEPRSEALARKTAELRIFPDDRGNMNVSVEDSRGELLVVSQFTLLASLRRGRRPSFDGAASPERASALYDRYVECLRARGLPVATGVFRAMMEVELVNDGPVTLMLEFPEPPSAP